MNIKPTELLVDTSTHPASRTTISAVLSSSREALSPGLQPSKKSTVCPNLYGQHM